MRDLTYREAMIWASGEILTQPFPDDWEKLNEADTYAYIEEHAVEGEEYVNAQWLWSKISLLCDSVNRLISELKNG